MPTKNSLELFEDSLSSTLEQANGQESKDDDDQVGADSRDSGSNDGSDA